MPYWLSYALFAMLNAHAHGHVHAHAHASKSGSKTFMHLTLHSNGFLGL